MNVQSARNVKEFVYVLASDGRDRPFRFHVPGHTGRHYEVSFERNDHLGAYCHRQDDDSGNACHGNSHAICYHVLASCLVAAESQGKVLSWCNGEADAERLARTGGEVFSVKSAQSGTSAWGVVRGEAKPEAIVVNELEQARARLESILTQTEGLSYTKTLRRGCIIMLDGLKGDGPLLKGQLEGFVNLAQEWPRFAEQIELVGVLLEDKAVELKPRLTIEQAYNELFDDHDSAIPAQHSRGRSKLFKT